MKKVIFLFLTTPFFTLQTNAECLKKDRAHHDRNVVRCEYHQEDIYRAYAQNPGRYGCTERYKRCVFCGCKIEEHSKKDNK